MTNKMIGLISALETCKDISTAYLGKEFIVEIRNLGYIEDDEGHIFMAKRKIRQPHLLNRLIKAILEEQDSQHPITFYTTLESVLSDLED